MAGFSRSSSITYNFLIPFVQDLVSMKLWHISETDNEYGKGFQKKKKITQKTLIGTDHTGHPVALW